MASLKQLQSTSATLYREGHMTDLFYGQGSMGALTVMEHAGTGHLEITPQKCYRDCREPRFASTCPTLPLCSPNKVKLDSYKLDPCIGEVATRLEKLRGIHASGIFQHYLTKGEGSDQNEAFLRDLAGPALKLRYVTEHTKKVAKDIQEELTRSGEASLVNSSYTGGCIAYEQLAPDSDLTGLIMYPSGENMDILVAVEITSGVKPKKQTSASFQCSSKILQLSSATLDSEVYCVVRTICNECLLLQLSAEEDGSLKFRELSKFTVESSTMTSVHLSPYIPGEYVATFGNGAVYLSTGSRESEIFSQSEHRFECNDVWWSAQFGAHPRQLLLTDSTGIAFCDIRVSEKCKRDLFTLPHKFLHTRERVMVTTPHRKNSLYQIVATTHQLILIDQRFPNVPVLQWDHLFEYPPQYIDLAYDVTVVDSDDVIILGSQLTPEVHCFQFNLNAAEIPPKAKAPLWKVSKPSDFAMIGHTSGLHVPISVLNQRLNRPLIGIAAVQNNSLKDAVTVCQLTSIGDLFYQQFTVTPSVKEVTWSLGPGSHRLRLGKEVREVCRKWVSEAEVMETEVTSPGYIRDLTEVAGDLTEVQQDLESTPEASISCALCKPLAPGLSRPSGEVTGPRECASCRLDTRTSVKLAECYGQATEKSFYSDEFSRNAQERIRQFTPDINPTEYKDASSQLLLAQWKGKSGEDLVPLLKKRETENKARIKERMRKKLGKKGMDASVFIESANGQGDDVDRASQSGDKSPSCTTPVSAASTSFIAPDEVRLYPTEDRPEESHTQEGASVNEKSRTVPVNEDERLSVISQASPRGSQRTTPNRKKRKIPDSVEASGSDKARTVPGDEDDRLSVISQASSKRSQESTPNRKKRKITDSVTELEVLGGSVSPVPKRIHSDGLPVGVTPPRHSQQRAFSVFNPRDQSPSTRKKIKKRKASGIMGF